jgi:hypothetical protein
MLARVFPFVCRMTPEEPPEQARWINQDLERGEGVRS